MNKKALSIALIVFMALSMCGCFLFKPTKLKTTLTTEYSDSDVVSVTCFYRDPHAKGGYTFERLPDDRLEGFLDEINSYQLMEHFGHTDYFWGGQFGIEMELSDGTYLRYDGTMLEHSRTSFKEDPAHDDQIDHGFIEVDGVVFWDRMAEYFSLVADNRTDIFTREY